MKIGELATATQVTINAIRHYVALGLLEPEKDRNNGYQIFGVDAVARLNFIKAAQRLGFQLSEIGGIFSDAGNAHSPCPRVRELLILRIAETRNTIDELNRLCNHIEATLAEWQAMPDSVPDGHSVCRLIESQIEAAGTQGPICSNAGKKVRSNGQ